MNYKIHIGILILFFSGIVHASKPMTFQLQSNGGNCNGCEWIYADGDIELNTAEKFEESLNREWKGEGCYSVIINSRGGNLIGAMRLGRSFRKNKCSLSIGRSVVDKVDRNNSYIEAGACISACAYAFLGGHRRWIDDNGVYGLHQHYIETNEFHISSLSREKINASLQLLSGLLVDYIHDMNVDSRLFSYAALQPSKSTFISLDRKTLEELRVITDGPFTPLPWSVEISEGKLFSTVLQPQIDADAQIGMIYCEIINQRKTIWLEIWIEARSSWQREFRAEAARINAININDTNNFPIQAISLKTKNNKNYVSIKISTNPELIFQFNNRDDFSWSMETSRSLADFFVGKFSTRGLSSHIPYHLKTCSLN